MNFRASAVQLLIKWDRAYIRAKEVARQYGVVGLHDAAAQSADKRRIALSAMALLAERLANARHCNPRMAKAIIRKAVAFAQARPNDPSRQALIDAFISDVTALIERERLGRERPERHESRIVLMPWWGSLPGEEKPAHE